MWSQSDYEALCSKTQKVLPHTHYFHSGAIGSGVCIFSKHPILETIQLRFSLNGYAHKVQHADWFGSKAVGLSQILCNGIRIKCKITFDCHYMRLILRHTIKRSSLC